VIYLVHHADAVGPEIDPQRPLSDRGRAHADSLAARALEREVRPEAIWHSGKLRARQTADAFRRVCSPGAEFAAIHGLQPNDPPFWVKDRLADETRSVMLVGHMPSLPRVLALLVTGSDREAGDFPLHGLVALDPQGSRWVERWRLEAPTA
jgi:phosphohistidine phosphatase